MTKENQKKLYDHFKGIAENVTKDTKGRDFKLPVRENCAKYAAEILKSFPEFKTETSEPEKKSGIFKRGK